MFTQVSANVLGMNQPCNMRGPCVNSGTFLGLILPNRINEGRT